MSTTKKLQISLSMQGIQLSARDENGLKDLLLTWDNKENFSIIMEKEFNFHLLDYQEIDVTIYNNKFLLTPKEYFSSLFITSYLEKAIGAKNTENCEIHHQDIEKEEAILSFFVPSAWKDYLAIRFPLSSFTYAHFLGNQLVQTSRFLRNQMHVWLNEDLAYVIMRKNGKLHIANAYPFSNATALAFYLHSIRESFDIVWTNDTFSIQGNHLKNLEFQQQLLALSIPIATAYEQA